MLSLRQAARVRRSPERGFPINELIIALVLMLFIGGSIITTIIGWRTHGSFGTFWQSRSLLGKAIVLFPGILLLPYIVILPGMVVDLIKGPDKNAGNDD